MRHTLPSSPLKSSSTRLQGWLFALSFFLFFSSIYIKHSLAAPNDKRFLDEPTPQKTERNQDEKPSKTNVIKIRKGARIQLRKGARIHFRKNTRIEVEDSSSNAPEDSTNPNDQREYQSKIKRLERLLERREELSKRQIRRLERQLRRLKESYQQRLKAQRERYEMRLRHQRENHQRILTRERARLRPKKEEPFFFQFDIGSAGAWYSPGNQHIALDVSTLTAGMVTTQSQEHLGGFSFLLWRMDSEGWTTHPTRPYDWLEKFEWGKLSFFGQYRFFGFEAGVLGYRHLRWALNDRTRPMEGQNLPQHSFVPESLNIFLPSIKLSFFLPGELMPRIGGRFSIGADILQWDFQSYRLYAEAELFFARGARITLRGQYQQERSLIQPENKNACSCPESALWEGNFLEGRLQADLDLFGLFLGRRRKEGEMADLWGPIFLNIGLRLRHVERHQIASSLGQLMFLEEPGTHWGFFVGLRIAFENRPTPR